jgi:hypothetical protein
MGIETPETCKHFDLYMSKNIENTIENTMRNTEPKRIKRRILGITPPTNLLHRALLINTALFPIYIHIFMALPVQREIIKGLHQEVLHFLWTRQEDGEDLWQKTESLPSSTREGCRFLIHLTLPKAYILTCSKKYRIKYCCHTDSLPPTSLQY